MPEEGAAPAATGWAAEVVAPGLRRKERRRRRRYRPTMLAEHTWVEAQERSDRCPDRELTHLLPRAKCHQQNREQRQLPQ